MKFLEWWESLTEEERNRIFTGSKTESIQAPINSSGENGFSFGAFLTDLRQADWLTRISDVQPKILASHCRFKNALEMLQSLTPEERDKLLKIVGGIYE